MVRLSEQDKRSTKTQILNSLYGKAKEDLHKRKSDMALKCREAYLEPFMPYIDNLPDELVTRHKDYIVSIDYEQRANIKGSAGKLEERWVNTSDTMRVNPHGDMSWRNQEAKPIRPHSSLLEECAELADAIIDLRNEENTMIAFIDDTFRANSGSLKIKKLWPTTLHKFLPAEPEKKAKKAAVENTAVIPDSLNVRLTTNLLEGE